MPQLTIDQTGVSNKHGHFTFGGNYETTQFDANPVQIWFGPYAPSSYLKIRHGWFRFRLPLPTGTTINSASLRFGIPAQWKGSIALRIHGHLIDDSDGPADHTEATTHDVTVASVAWSTEELGAGSMVYSEDFASVLQELINQGGWAEDNYITIYVVDDGGSYYTYVYDYNSIVTEQYQATITHPIAWLNSDDALPHLIIDYTVDTPDPGDGDEAIEHELTIEQIIICFTGKVTVINSLSIEQDIVFVVDRIRNVVDDLEIVQSYKLIVPYSLSVEDYTLITQTISCGVVRSVTVEHTVVLTQDVIGNTDEYKTVISTLNPENDDIVVTRAYSRDGEDTIELEQTVDTNLKTRSVIHGLSLSHTVSTDGSVIEAIEVHNTLVITQDIDFNRNAPRSHNSEIDITHFVIGYFEERDGCERQDTIYNPYADSSVDFPSEPTLTEAADITLACPPDTPTVTITLPAPLFGDREELLITRIQRQTRGGLLKTFSSDVWPKVRTFRYKFEHLPTDKIEEMFTFLGQTLGLKMRLTDHEGRLWDGYIVNPQGEAGQFMRICGNTTEFDFDGVEV